MWWGHRACVVEDMAMRPMRLVILLVAGLLLIGCAHRLTYAQRYYAACLRAGQPEGECAMRSIEMEQKEDAALKAMPPRNCSTNSFTHITTCW